VTTGSASLPVVLGAGDSAQLDGIWEFFPGDHGRSDLDGIAPTPIAVPALWEAQGHLELDGVAWYRRRFELADASRYWTLHFGAVMDLAEVYLNGVFIGAHEQPFTPFELDVTAVLRAGDNVLDVRVTDPSLDDPRHIRMAHGKQGWANHVFPSRPSLYLTYGGIWQPVTLRRHGALVIRDVFVNGDPDDLRVRVELANVDRNERWAVLGLRTLGLVHEHVVRLPPQSVDVIETSLGSTAAAMWSPDSPALHELLVDVKAEELLSDRRRLRYGVRTIRVDGTRLLLNGLPYRMKSVLVQGFRAEQLYAEGSRDQIVEEVLAAKSMGFNTLRLHIKAFEPTYLDVCDELGMLVHSDLPIAEPIAHEEIGNGTELSQRAIAAVNEQIRRDRNHPCVILWSAMNELGLDREGVRDWPVYEEFARTLYAAAVAADPTRPVIENDWVEPDPDRVFCSPILTAHWYGRLHAEYLDKLESACAEWQSCGRPLFVTEFGDWGLPAMPQIAAAPFWDPREIYSAGLANTLWPATIGRFVRETQRYQGISDRLQIEVFRRHDHIGGYCLTELTDVPHELNGVLDLHRQPKPLAAIEIARANQTVLPILDLESLVVCRGAEITAPLHVANDGDELLDVEVTVRFGGAVAVPADRLMTFDAGHLTVAALEERFGEGTTGIRAGTLAANRTVRIGLISVTAPEVTGNHDLLVTLRAEGHVVAENRYPVHVIEAASAPFEVRVHGPAGEALQAIGARLGSSGPLVVAEEALDRTSGALAREALAHGETVVVLAQTAMAAEHYPVPLELAAVETAWGSSVFHFTTDSGVTPSLPRRNLLVAEESTIQAQSVIVGIDGVGFPDEPVVIAYKPVPGSITGWVVGMHRVGAGRLICCQYRLTARAAAADAAAQALLADIVAWAAAPRPPTQRRETTLVDGRSLSFYDYPEATAK
jgi:hypothetical protein